MTFIDGITCYSIERERKQKSGVVFLDVIEINISRVRRQCGVLLSNFDSHLSSVDR